MDCQLWLTVVLGECTSIETETSYENIIINKIIVLSLLVISVH